jgi:hypothetical protein
VPATVTVDVNTAGPVQVALPNSVNVIVPVGAGPGGEAASRCAVSEIAPPTVAEGVAVVVRPGFAGVTTTDSPGAPQADVAAALFASPL